MNRSAAFGAGTNLKLPERDKPGPRWDEEMSLSGTSLPEPVWEPAASPSPTTETSYSNLRAAKPESDTVVYTLGEPLKSPEAPRGIEYPVLHGDASAPALPADPAGELLERLEAAERMRPQDMRGEF